MSAAEDRIAAVLRGPRGPHIAAFFDFDGTLIDGFSATSFLLGSGIGLPRLAYGVFGRGPLPVARLLARSVIGEPGDRDIRFAHEAARRASRGLSDAELTGIAEHVFTRRIAARLRPEMWALVQAHRRMGHRVAVVTSATHWQVHPLAASLGVDDVLCSESASIPLRGTGKAVAVIEFATRHAIDLAASHAYGDAGDDVAFLRACGHPCAVSPRTALARAAQEHGWPIVRIVQRPGLDPVTAVRTVAAWTGTATGIGTAFGLAATGLDRREAAELGMALASRACLELAGIRVSIQGGEHLAHRPAVFLFNHQSWLDVAIMARLLRREYTGFAKRELDRVPGLSGFGRMFEAVFVDRGAIASISDYLNPVLDLLRRGVSVAVAPEGTRSLTPAPGAFHKGAFLAARKARVPLIPVVIRNSGRLMPRGGRTVRAGRIDVTVLEPIDPTRWRLGEFATRIDELRGQYISTLIMGSAR